MNRMNVHVSPAAEVMEVLSLLDRWYLAMSAHGVLWIRPRKGKASLHDYALLVKRLHGSHQPGFPHSIIIDFEEAGVSKRDWADMLRLTYVFAQSIHARCRVLQRSSKNAQPDAVGSDGAGPDEPGMTDVGEDGAALGHRAQMRILIESSAMN